MSTSAAPAVRQIPEERLDAACNQAAVQFHGRSYSELKPLDQLLLRKRTRFVLKAARTDIAASVASAADIISAHHGCDTYRDANEDGQTLWRVTCDGCDWDVVMTGAPSDDHARHVAEMLVAASL